MSDEGGSRLDRPYRGPAGGAPTGVPFPPDHLSLFRKRQLRKGWHYVSFWSPELLLCAAQVQVGFLNNQYWAVWDRRTQRLTKKTHFFLHRVQVSDDRLTVEDGDVSIDLPLTPTDTFVVYRPEGRAYIWSRKALCTNAQATVRIGPETRSVAGTAFVDLNAGYHFRHTRWRWSAGAFVTADGKHVAWNAITGLFDTRSDSERTIWLDGAGREIDRVHFSHEANEVEFTDGGSLRFTEEARLRKRVGLFVIRSKYEHAFGRYSGTLPGGIEVVDAVGVRERQDALW